MTITGQLLLFIIAILVAYIAGLASDDERKDDAGFVALFLLALVIVIALTRFFVLL